MDKLSQFKMHIENSVASVVRRMGNDIVKKLAERGIKTAYTADMTRLDRGTGRANVIGVGITTNIELQNIKDEVKIVVNDYATKHSAIENINAST